MEKKIIKILKEINPDVEDYASETNLVEDGYLDSLAIVQIVTALEEKYDIDIDPEDIIPENFSSVNKIILLVQKYMEN